MLCRVQVITEDAGRAVVAKFQKILSGGPASCVRHSFVAGTLVLMADGSTTPISEVEIGDEVRATDPATGETTDRKVVATIVHDDEGDMTKLTVTGEDGTTGTVDATSWHPVWVDDEDRFVNIGDLKPGQRLKSADGTSPVVSSVERYTHLEPVYDLTIDGIHTYYVVSDGVDFLVHNCEKSVSIYRTPKSSDLNHEIANGPNPASHQDGDQSVYFGEYGVAAEYQGRGGMLTGWSGTT
ncbi:hypothetical protein CKY47_29290 [Saccharothrix yanglingensis]|uniref:Hint domain-containing protein n=1 Tax=Saccharothrix yanglingensis TaxID=659496 RepID=A0ABU0X796_9PSEU|nr:hypothetical protein [Saccharothrix yanglingensis]